MDNIVSSGEPLKKKSGRRKKSEIEQQLHQQSQVNISISIDEDPTQNNIQLTQPVQLSEEIPLKKRGRKPKGGKLILKKSEEDEKPIHIENIILHLKCSLNDLNNYNTTLNKLMTNELTYNPEIPPEIQTYNSEVCSNTFATYEINNNSNQVDKNFAYSEPITNKLNKSTDTMCEICRNHISENDTENNEDIDINMKDINMKLKHLKLNLYKNMLQDKKSACFWCTYEYDNPPCYIPKHEMNDKIFGYGSFCRPECAVAYLMKENIDDSTKFERYHLLNQIYSKIYEYKKNIKPAPNPYYLLDKFYGSLSIQEYRKLLKTEHLLLVIDKPMTRILPELYEDNDNFILSIYGSSNPSQLNANSMYKVKRQSEKQQVPNKNKIMRDKFGMAPST